MDWRSERGVDSRGGKRQGRGGRTPRRSGGRTPRRRWREDSKEEQREDSKEERREDAQEERREDSKEERREGSKEEQREDAQEDRLEDSQEERQTWAGWRWAPGWPMPAGLPGAKTASGQAERRAGRWGRRGQESWALCPL